MQPDKIKKLLACAEVAKKKAITPFSKFPVGAALETNSGKIYTGCNIEVSSYGLTICAERVAIFKAISEGESEFKTLVITADTKEFCPPCGACRQVIIEYAPEIKIILLNGQGKTEQTTISDLLPRAFDKDILENR